MATSNDYYKVLGVDRSATADEIRKAYRKLARKYHPDVNKADDAATKFAEVQEAYDTLSDAEKRRVYDLYGTSGGGFRGNPRWAQGEKGGFGGVDFADIFGQAFGGGSDGFGGVGGAQGGGSRHGGAPQSAKGQDRTMSITVTFMTALKGGIEEIPVGDATAKLRIPAGFESGKKLRLKGKGEPSLMGGSAGDLLVTVTVGGHPMYQRKGLDIEMDVDLNIAEAALGVKVTLPLPLGGSVDMSIPPGVSSGARLRVKGKGCSTSKGKVGDFYAVIHIIAPTEIDEETKQLLEQLQQCLPNPRIVENDHSEVEESDTAS